MSLTKMLLAPVALPKKVVVLTATDPLHAGWCSALCKGVHRREKWREWPRDVHTTRQLALAHQDLFAASLCALWAGRALAARDRAHQGISRDAAA